MNKMENAYIDDNGLVRVRETNRVLATDCTPEDAKRIVACINSCWGIPSDKLDAAPVLGLISSIMTKLEETQVELEKLKEKKKTSRKIDSGERGQIIPLNPQTS